MYRNKLYFCTTKYFEKYMIYTVAFKGDDGQRLLNKQLQDQPLLNNDSVDNGCSTATENVFYIVSDTGLYLEGERDKQVSLE